MSGELILFKRTRELERKIADFLNNITQAGVIFGTAMQQYLEEGANEAYAAKRAQVSSLEAANDVLRRDVEHQMYSNMILPDMRSDILTIIEGCDKIINKYETDLILYGVEKPKIPNEIKENISELVRLNLECVAALVGAVRSFFASSRTGDKIQYVLFLENQIDDLALEIKRTFFDNKKMTLARQLQLKDFVYSIEKISDIAEDISDVLTVVSAKHAV